MITILRRIFLGRRKSCAPVPVDRRKKPSMRQADEQLQEAVAGLTKVLRESLEDAPK